MASVNKVILIGRVGKDPELRYLNNGDPVVSLSLATSKKYKDKSGERQEKTSWHKIVFFRSLALIVSEYVKSGKQIYIEGEIDYKKYTDKSGVERYTTDIIANEMIMLSSKQGQPESHESERSKTETQSGGFDDMEDPDVPF